MDAPGAIFIIPSIVIGVPLGAQIIQRIRPETFRRICMSFDAWIVGFGLSTLLKDLRLVQSNAACLVLVAVGILDTYLLYRFCTVQLPDAIRAEGARAPEVQPLEIRTAIRTADRRREPALPIALDQVFQDCARLEHDEIAVLDHREFAGRRVLLERMTRRLEGDRHRAVAAAA